MLIASRAFPGSLRLGTGTGSVDTAFKYYDYEFVCSLVNRSLGNIILCVTVNMHICCIWTLDD